MIRVGDAIDNPVTGPAMTFLLTGRETNGRTTPAHRHARPPRLVRRRRTPPPPTGGAFLGGGLGEITLRILWRGTALRGR